MAESRWMGGFDAFAGDGGTEPDTSDGEWESGEDGRQPNVRVGPEFTPADRRRGIDKQNENLKAAREPHIQKIGKQDVYLARGFDGAQFIGYLKDGGKFTRSGNMEITVVIPAEYKINAFSLTDAVGMPLSIDVRVWEPYQEAVDNAG